MAAFIPITGEERCMNAVEKAGKGELAEISIVLSPFSQSSTTVKGIASPSPTVQTQTSISGNLISIPMHLTTSRMVCLRATTQDCLSVAQTIYPVTSTPEVEGSSGHPIFISTPPNAAVTPVPPSATCSTSSTGSAFLCSEGNKISPDGRYKRPGASVTSTRQNKSRCHSASESVTLEEPGTVALSPREQRALRRKEKSRLAAKMRRNQESNILSCLLQALPVSLPDTTANSDGNSKTPTGLNLEKSGVIRMAGQTLFLYNSLSQVLGSKAVPFISLLSKSLFGLLVHPSDSTVVYATPPLAEAISWPWINLIGVKLDSLADGGTMPSRPGETVRLRMLEQISSPTKNSVHISAHNRPTTPLRSPTHSPASTASNSANSCGDQTSPLWSPHLYRSSKNGITVGASGAQLPPFTGVGKTSPYLVCTCFAILRVPITKPEEIRLNSSSVETTPTTFSPNTHLNLYVLQPTPNLGSPKDSSDSMTLLGLSQLGKSSSTSLSSNTPILPTSTSPFHRSKERYFLNRQRRLLMQNPPTKPDNEEIIPPRHLFCMVLDRNLNVKWVEHSGSVTTSVFAPMSGQPFLDFIALEDLRTVSKLLNDCAQKKASLWTPSYRLRIPVAQLNGNQSWSGPSKFVWMRSIFSTSLDSNIRCIHQPIGDVQLSGVQFYLHQSKPSTVKACQNEGRRLISSSLSLESASTTQEKRPIRVLKLQPQRRSLPRQPLTAPNLQPISVTSRLPSNSGPYLAPLTATPARDAPIAYESSACLTPQAIVTTPWVIYTRSLSTPQTDLVKSLAPLPPAQSIPPTPPPPPPPDLALPAPPPPPISLPQNSSFTCLLPSVCNDVHRQHSNKIPRLSPPVGLVEPLQTEKGQSTASSSNLNLPDMLQELDPETLAMLENEDAKSDSLLTSLSFDDILSSISITPGSGDEVTQDKAACPSESFCSGESSPPSLPESFVSSTSCNRYDQQQQQQQQTQQRQHQSHQQRDISLFNDVELESDLPSDSDEFWDAFVTNVMNLPLDSTNFPMDVR
ncbi:hypothetical protein Aperf_G00000054354 [Anoplocephala perfoliata]